MDNIINQLNKSDWDFKGHDTQYMTHGIHKYPARMIPQIARALILAFSNKNDLIVDPFVGSGTVLTEAFLNSRDSIGNDLNPLGILLTKVRTTPLGGDKLAKIFKQIKINVLKNKYIDPDYIDPEIKNSIEETNLHYWFKDYVLIDLSIIKKSINELNILKSEKDFFLVCFSATVRDSSNLRSGEYKIYRIPPNKLDLYKPDVYGKFYEITEKYISKMSDFYIYCKQNKLRNKVIITKSDARYLPKEYKKGSTDLIITSPPYGDSQTTVAYGQFSRYSLIWLGYKKKEIYEIDKILLGGRPSELISEIKSPTLKLKLNEIKERDKERANDTEWFMVDLYLTLKEMSRILKKGGIACIVIGNRAVRRIRIPTSKIIEEMVINMPNDFKMKHLITIGRNIPTKNNPISSKFKLADGSVEWIKTMSTEDIVILQK
ncbi:MAG: DNA methyltransferase [Patescibacteria group bacterium]|jgi:DNA modification methylase